MFFSISPSLFFSILLDDIWIFFHKTTTFSYWSPLFHQFSQIPWFLSFFYCSFIHVLSIDFLPFLPLHVFPRGLHMLCECFTLESQSIIFQFQVHSFIWDFSFTLQNIIWCECISSWTVLVVFYIFCYDGFLFYSGHNTFNFSNISLTYQMFRNDVFSYQLFHHLLFVFILLICSLIPLLLWDILFEITLIWIS